jgi:hypothetical protein
MMPCHECWGSGTLRGYFLRWVSPAPASQQDTRAEQRRLQAARWADQEPAEEEHPCPLCAGTGQLRDHEAEALAAEAAAPSPSNCLAIYDPTTRQWWPGAKPTGRPDE